MKFGINVDCTKDEMEEIYDQFIEIMLLTKSFLEDCFLEDKYCMFLSKESKENLVSMVYDLHLDYRSQTYFEK